MNKKDYINITVRYRIPRNMIEDFLEKVSPFILYAQDEPYKVETIRKRIEKRRKFILDQLMNIEREKIGRLFKRLAARGYGHTYRTFQRDVSDLAIHGFIETDIVRGGKDGATTYITLPKMESL